MFEQLQTEVHVMMHLRHSRLIALREARALETLWVFADMPEHPPAKRPLVR